MEAVSAASDTDRQHMAEALLQAQLANDFGEVPVGAVVVREGIVIGTGFNAMIRSNDPTAHAEIVAIRAAASRVGNYRLEGCDLFVTLEPCAMCVGAILHARIQRVVFGAYDPKTGAAGSVLDAFGISKLNHQTRVRAGVMEDECSALLLGFFRSRRIQQRQERLANHPLRDDALRTPEAAFEPLGKSKYCSNYISHLRTLSGLRMHYLDEGPGNAVRTVLLIHASPFWSYWFQNKLLTLTTEGFRVVVPDLIGFGKSDKPKRRSAHSAAFHNQVLAELVQHLGVRNLISVLQNGRCEVGWNLPFLLPPTVVCRTIYALPECLTNGQLEYWQRAPFPNVGYTAAIAAFGGLLRAQVPPPDHQIDATLMPESVLGYEDDGATLAGFVEQVSSK